MNLGYFEESGVSYRRDTRQVPVQAHETLFFYTWHYHPTGDSGVEFVVIQGRGERAKQAFKALLDRWNAGHPTTWAYMPGMHASNATRH